MIAFLILAAVALFAIVAKMTGFHKQLKPRTYRERVDGGIRLRRTATGLGAILPGGLFAWARETILGVISRILQLPLIVRTFRTAIDGLRKPRYVNLPSIGAVFADTPKLIEDLRAKLASIHAEMETIQNQADEQKRPVNEEETKRMEALYEAFNQIEADIARREKLYSMEQRRAQPVRKTTPQGTGLETPQASTQLPARHDISGGDQTAAMRGTGGFQAFGEFCRSVCSAVVSGRPDPRLSPFQAAAPSTYGNEGTGADGGYLIPPDFRTSILKKVMAEDSLIGRTDQNTTSSNSINIPVDETTPWQTTGGIQVYWEGEAAAYTQSKPALKSVNVRAHKLTALVPVTDEQLEDGPSLEAYLRNKTPDKLNFKINDGLVNGDGVGKLTGIMNAAAKLAVPKEGGQAAATVNFTNIVKMWSRIYDPCRRRGIWLVNQDIEPQLFQMVVPGTQAAFPAYMPPGGLSQSPYGTLMGRPVVYTEACQTLGTEGDIIFWDPSTYLSLMKATGIRSDVSIHLWFDQGLTAFRFTMRLGGLPWWSSTIARKNGANTLSCMVTLQTR